MARAGQRPLCGAAVLAVTHCSGGRMSQPSAGFLRPQRPSLPPLGGARAAHTELTLGRGWTWGRRPVGVPALLGPASARSYFRLLASGPWPSPKLGVGLPWAALGAACGSSRVRARPDSLHFLFWGQGSRKRLCAGLGQPAPRDSRAAAPQVFPFLEETGVLSGRDQRAVCLSRREPRRCPAGSLWGWAPVAFPAVRGFPRSPVGNCFSPESVQGPAGLHSARAGLWVARRGKHALGQNHWVGAYSVSWVCPSVLVSSQSKSEGIAIPAS